MSLQRSARNLSRQKEALARLSSLGLEAVRRAYMFLPDLGEIVSRVISEGKEGILNVKPKLFYPLRPMLAQGMDDINELSDNISRFSLEFKFKTYCKIFLVRDGTSTFIS